MPDPRLLILASVLAGVAAAAQAWRGLKPGPGDDGASAIAGRWATDVARVVRGRPALQDALCAAGGAALGLLLGGGVGAAIGAGCALAARRLAADRRRRARIAATERSMPAAARALADALRGGLPVRGAITQVAGDGSIGAALRADLQALAAAIERGAAVGDGLVWLAGRGGPGLRVVCGTVAVQRETGGALAGSLDRLARAGEAAARLEHERAAATSQARATVRTVAALPVIALAGAELAGGGLLARVAAHPLALALLVAGFVLEVTAVLAVRAIVGSAK